MFEVCFSSPDLSNLPGKQRCSALLDLDRSCLLTGLLVVHEFPERRFCGHRVGVFAVFTALLHVLKNSPRDHTTNWSINPYMIGARLSPGPTDDPLRLPQRPAVAALAWLCPEVPIGIWRRFLSDAGTGIATSSTPLLKLAFASSTLAPSGSGISR